MESEQKQSKQSKIVLTGSKLKTTAPPFTKQEKITESVIDNLIGRGGLPVTLTTKKWFIDFMADVEVLYSCPTYSNIIQKLQKKSDAIRANLVENLNNREYSLAIDEWTGINRKTFLGCISTYIDFTSGKLVSIKLFLQELLHVRTAADLNLAIRNKLDLLGVRNAPYSISTDNCGVMKKEFQNIVKNDFLSFFHENSEEDVDFCEDCFIVEHQFDIPPPNLLNGLVVRRIFYSFACAMD